MALDLQQRSAQYGHWRHHAKTKTENGCIASTFLSDQKREENRECKTLNEVKKNGKVLWSEIFSQLTRPIEVAKACGFRIFFVSSFTDKYPKHFQDRLIDLAGASLKTLFLTRNDLEQGYRKFAAAEGYRRTLTLDLLLNSSKHSKISKEKRKIRTMSL